MTSPNRPLAWFAISVLGFLAGCATRPTGSAQTAPVIAAQPKIELLGFPDCPNTPAMRANLTAALSSISKGWTFADTNQETLLESDIRRGYPTPTILVNDRDLFGLPVPTAPSMGCRMYAGGVPDAKGIAAQLSAAATK